MSSRFFESDEFMVFCTDAFMIFLVTFPSWFFCSDVFMIFCSDAFTFCSDAFTMFCSVAFMNFCSDAFTMFFRVSCMNICSDACNTMFCSVAFMNFCSDACRILLLLFISFYYYFIAIGHTRVRMTNCAAILTVFMLHVCLFPDTPASFLPPKGGRYTWCHDELMLNVLRCLLTY